MAAPTATLRRRLGVPTLGGRFMGAVGEGAHAAHESVVIEHSDTTDGPDVAAMIANVE